VVQHPSWKLLKEAAVRVDGYSLVVLGSFVRAAFAKSGNVIEVPRRNSLKKNAFYFSYKILEKRCYLIFTTIISTKKINNKSVDYEP